MGGAAERPLVDRCLKALQELVPIETWTWRQHARQDGTRADARVELVLDGRRLELAVDARTGLRATHVGPLAHRARAIAAKGTPFLVCADRVPAALGEQLRQAGVAYVDQGGNAFLHTPGVYVLVTGRPAITTKQRGGLTGTDVRLLGVFLRDPDAGEAVQAELAARAGMALGAVGRARERLTELCLLTRLAKRRWRIADRAAALQRFAEGWGTVVRHKLRPVRYRYVGREPLERVLRTKGKDTECLLGGERAAALLTQALRTDHATLHAPRQDREDAACELKLALDAGGPITLLDRYGEGDAFHPPRKPPLVDPLLIWAECLTVPDERVAEAARQLYERYLETAP